MYYDVMSVNFRRRLLVSVVILSYVYDGVMAVTLSYFTELGIPLFQHNRVDLWRNLCTSLLYFVLHVRCRRKKSSRSLSHLLMSFCNF